MRDRRKQRKHAGRVPGHVAIDHEAIMHFITSVRVLIPPGCPVLSHFPLLSRHSMISPYLLLLSPPLIVLLRARSVQPEVVVHYWGGQKCYVQRNSLSFNTVVGYNFLSFVRGCRECILGTTFMD